MPGLGEDKGRGEYPPPTHSSVGARDAEIVRRIGGLMQTEETREAQEAVTVYLSEEALEALKEIAEKRGGIGLGEALKEAIGNDLFILREAANGSQILIRRPG